MTRLTKEKKREFGVRPGPRMFWQATCPKCGTTVEQDGSQVGLVRSVELTDCPDHELASEISAAGLGRRSG